MDKYSGSKLNQGSESPAPKRLLKVIRTKDSETPEAAQARVNESKVYKAEGEYHTNFMGTSKDAKSLARRELHVGKDPSLCPLCLKVGNSGILHGKRLTPVEWGQAKAYAKMTNKKQMSVGARKTELETRLSKAQALAEVEKQALAEAEKKKKTSSKKTESKGTPPVEDPKLPSGEKILDILNKVNPENAE
jgi:hypothetical protein